jgi:tRNA threonylcarbamoyladenosine biosynthesis protein TsaE
VRKDEAAAKVAHARPTARLAPCRKVDNDAVVWIVTPDAASLHDLGRRVGEALFPCAVLLLEGPLGAGKTTFAQGIAAGLGVGGSVPSPTYALVHEYEGGRLPLRHADVYRMESADELVSAGIEERVGVDGVWIVEWASRFADSWPGGHLVVELRTEGEGRAVRMSATDARHARLIPGP